MGSGRDDVTVRGKSPQLSTSRTANVRCNIAYNKLADPIS
jgi:hypothetical protein